jgi:hypothetical protein
VATAKTVRAVTSFACTVGEVEYLVHSGEVLDASHPAAKARPELFEPVADTTAPKRRTRRT